LSAPNADLVKEIRLLVIVLADLVERLHEIAAMLEVEGES